MTKYLISVSESSFEEFEIEADSREEAEQEAFNRSTFEEPFIDSVEVQS